MAVTKETYTAAATWTAAQLATLFEDAFVDAGLMTAWYDSFLSGSIENRILEITYDGTKTYGKAYYWFTFTTSTVGVAIATGWNATTHVPTGTQYLDYFSTATNTQSNHYGIRTGLTTGTAIELVRYTASGYSWFAFRNGATPTSFFIAPASTVIAPWIDLNKVVFHHFITVSFDVTGVTANTSFINRYLLRRSYAAQGSLGGYANSNLYTGGGSSFVTLWYTGLGNRSGGLNSGSDSSIRVPYGFNSSNPEYTTNYTPVINGYSYSSYVTSNMPADFGIFFNYGVTAFAFGDRIVVTAGVEEWEVYAFANSTSSADYASALMLARVV